jgi:hypothetical protein
MSYYKINYKRKCPLCKKFSIIPLRYQICRDCALKIKERNKKEREDNIKGFFEKM